MQKSDYRKMASAEIPPTMTAEMLMTLPIPAAEELLGEEVLWEEVVEVVGDEFEDGLLELLSLLDGSALGVGSSVEIGLRYVAVEATLWMLIKS